MERNIFLPRQIHLRAVQIEALRDLNLRLHDVDAGHHFGDGVLDLHARIHFDEIQFARVRIDQKLDGRRAVIFRFARQRHRRVREPLANFRVEVHGRRDFHHFLVSPLHRAIALVQMENISVRVGQDLHFDVPRAANVALEKNSVVAERRSGLGPRFLQARQQQLRALHHAHPAPAAAERGFHHQRIADFVRDALRVVLLRHRLFRARHDRQAGFLRQPPRRRLIAQQIEQVRARSNESNSRRGAGSRQRRIFREKSVARVDGVDAALLRQRHDSIDVQIGLDRPFAFADQIGFVRLEPMQAEAVLVGIHGGGADFQFVGGAENANRDFPAIQGQQFFYRHRSDFPGISPHFHCMALAERIGLHRPQRQFARLLSPEITAYQTIQVVLFLAYDMVGN